jgi:O-antigen ligase
MFHAMSTNQGEVRLNEREPVGKLARWLTVVLLAAVPVTSFPPISELFGESTVAPLSLIPLVILIFAWALPQLATGQVIPKLVLPLLLFAGLAVLSSALGLIHPLLPYKGQTPLARETRALATLLVGLAFYLSVTLVFRDRAVLRPALIGLYLGGMATMAWSLLQARYLLPDVTEVPAQFNQLHRLLSIRDIIPHRVQGLAFEPSWFGNQLVVLYIPLWIASVLTGWSQWRRVSRWLSVELILLLLGVGLLIAARSRISIGALLLIMAVLFLAVVWRLGGRFRILQRLPIGARQAILLAVGVAALTAAGAGVALAARQFDPRMARSLTVFTEPEAIRSEHPYTLTYEIANRAAFAERVVYWRSGWGVFERYPILGVGLGNSGFLFEETVPAFGHSLKEIRIALNPANPDFPNPKNLWVRILGETGLAGFATFSVWMLLVLSAARMLWRSPDRGTRAIGLAGILWTVAFFVEGFSLDTFALPEMWIVPALVTAHIAGASADHSVRDLEPDQEPT